MSLTPLSWLHHLVKPLTLRWQLTVWTAGWFLVLSLGLVLFINSMTAVQIPRVLQVELVPTPQPLSDSSTALSTPTFEAPPSFVEPPVSQARGIQEIVIHQVRLISLIGAGVFVLVGAVGAYWIAKQSLHPVQHLSQLVQNIHAQTLHQRLPAERIFGLAKVESGFTR